LVYYILRKINFKVSGMHHFCLSFVKHFISGYKHCDVYIKFLYVYLRYSLFP
jgi:hypothetical protein